MFEHGGVNATPARALDGAARGDELARLRDRIERIERTTRIGSDARVLPAPSRIAELLPGGGLRVGSAYALGRSMPLLSTLLAAPSSTGTWCAVVGMPEFGVEHAIETGIDLDRLVLVPHPGERWLGVAAALAEVMGVVALRPGGRVRDSEAARLAARLRERETVLLAQGDWPGAEASIAVESIEWSGLGAGHGYLDRGEATVVVAARRAMGARRARILLAGQPVVEDPGAVGRLETNRSATSPGSRRPSAASADDAALRAVG